MCKKKKNWHLYNWFAHKKLNKYILKTYYSITCGLRNKQNKSIICFKKYIMILLIIISSLTAIS